MASAEKRGIPNLVEPRFERIGGIEYAMSSPGCKHQMALLAIGAQLQEKLSPLRLYANCSPFRCVPPV